MGIIDDVLCAVAMLKLQVLKFWERKKNKYSSNSLLLLRKVECEILLISSERAAQQSKR